MKTRGFMLHFETSIRILHLRYDAPVKGITRGHKREAREPLTHDLAATPAQHRRTFLRQVAMSLIAGIAGADPIETALPRFARSRPSLRCSISASLPTTLRRTT